MATTRKVTPEELEHLAATLGGYIEMGNPLIDVLVVGGRDVAYSAKPERAA